MTIWNYEVLAQFKQARIGSNIITFDDLHKEINLEYGGKEYHCWVVRKDKRDYILLNKNLNKLPLRIKETKIITKASSVYHQIKRGSSVGFAPEKNYTFRELINEFYNVSHSNHPHFILFKIIAMASYIERINVRICSNVEFGKDGTFAVLRYLTNQVAVFSKPRTMAKLEYGVVNRVLVVNELVPKTEEEKRNIGDFLLDMGDFKPIYEKKSRASALHGTRDSYDITNTSLIIFYNTIQEIAPSDKEWYFDDVFGINVTERYLPLKFNGKIDIDQFTEKTLYNEHTDEELLKIARTIEWYKQNYESALKPYKADLSFIKISGRQRKSFERITYFLNLYSSDEHEFKQLVNLLLKCYYDYENMIKNNTSLNTFEGPDIKIKNNPDFEQLNPIVEDVLEFPELKQDKNFDLVFADSSLQLVSPLLPKQNPLEIIRQLDKGDGVLTDEIARGLNTSAGELYPTITKLAEDGDIFEHKPDRWKVLE